MIYATGDLHGNTLRFQPQYFPEQAGMTKDDYMIVCGDAGLVWHGDKSDDPQLDRLEALPFTVLFVDGNHENFDALNEEGTTKRRAFYVIHDYREPFRSAVVLALTPISSRCVCRFA